MKHRYQNGGGEGRTLADVDTTGCAFPFRMYSPAAVTNVTCGISSVMETISCDLPQLLPKLPLEFDFFFGSFWFCLLYSGQSSELPTL